MNPSMKGFFEQEKKRVLTPSPFFHQRVMARLDQGLRRESGLWELIPGTARPVFALALLLMIVFMAMEFMVPVVPQRGYVEAALDAEQTGSESFLYEDTEVPSEQELLERVVLEIGQ